MTFNPFIEALVQAGSGVLIAVLILVGLYRLANRYLGQFITNQAAQTAAIVQLTTAIEASTEKDNSEHREMLVLLRFIAQQQQDFKEVAIEHERRKEQAHPHCPIRTPED